MKLMYQGSVKSVYDDNESTVFEYTDKYSVFDWGSMPDEIKDKGESLALMGAMFFERLGDSSFWSNWQAPGTNDLLTRFCQKGADHHFIELIKGKPRQMRVKKIDVIHPKVIVQGGQMHLDYGEYECSPVDTLVPLEVIFRFGMSEGSSLLKRMGDLDYLQEIGINEDFKVGDKLDIPVVEFSTKLEESDRYIGCSEAKQIAGLNQNEFEELKNYAQLVALRLRDLFSQSEIELLDGKFEFAFIQNGDKRSFMLVDSIGPDELRLIYKGQQLSKERLRSFYRGSSWQRSVELAKERAEREGILDWKSLCEEKPVPCDPALLANVSGIYTALANRVCGKKVFSDSIELEKLWEKL